MVKRKSRKTRKAARKLAPRRAKAKNASARRTATPKVRPGFISHTELASTDPVATRDWCAKVLGWKFGEPMPTPTGPYYMWRFTDTGGGIRANRPPEAPGSIPYCEVADIKASYAKAVEAGAKELLWPQALPSGMGWIAIVIAPGGVAIGFWSLK